MPQPKRFAAAILVPILIGIIGLETLMRNGRMDAIRPVDVLQLLGSGMCFGVALSAIFMMLRAPRP